LGTILVVRGVVTIPAAGGRDGSLILIPGPACGLS
jgi:hypothetical protein